MEKESMKDEKKGGDILFDIRHLTHTFETEEGKQILQELGIKDEYEGIGNCIVGYAAPDALKPQVERKSDYVVWVK